MKKLTLKLSAMIIVLYMIVASIVPFSVGAAPKTYSSEYNSGTRDEVCTTLEGTSVSSYYTGSYTYEKISNKSSTALQNALHDLMTSTHSYKSSYNDCHYKADRTDCQNGDGSISLIYTSYSATMSQWDGWNREHVWPKSLGGNSTKGGGADLHHIRPSDAGVNSSRGHKKYGNSNGGTAKYGTNPATGYLGGTYNSTYFEPLDNVKGDVARICLYVYVRWGREWGADSLTEVFESVDVLLEWCALDPVDTWEMGRNEVVQGIQGNRNVFIDYPELAWQMLGKTAPDNLVTPSGNTGSGNVGGGDIGGGDEETEGNGGEIITPPEATITPISTIKSSSNGNFTAEGVVVGANAKSFLLQDETGVILVYLNSAPSVKVGDKARVEGATSEYGGAKQFGQGSVCTKLGTETVTYPTPMLIDGAKCDGYLNKVTMDYVKVRGKLTSSGNYYNLAIDGATITGSITYPANTSQLTPYLNKDVEVVGYVTGVTGSSAKYLNIMMTGISEYNESAPCTHGNTQIRDKVNATCGEGGYTGDTYCADCGEKIATGKATQPTGNHTWGSWTKVSDTQEKRECSVCHKAETRTVTPVTPPASCTHTNTRLDGVVEPNCGNEGYSGDTYCADCGVKLSDGEPMAPIGYHSFGDWTAADGQLVRECSICHQTESKACTHTSTEIRDKVNATCGEGGYTGDTYCTVCGIKTADGSATNATGDHSFGEWTDVEGTQNQTRECSVCHKTEQRDNSCTHANADIINKKDATTDEEGYTGDLACTECGKIIVAGQSIPKKTAPVDTDKGDASSEGCNSVAIMPVSIICLAGAIALVTKKRK